MLSPMDDRLDTLASVRAGGIRLALLVCAAGALASLLAGVAMGAGRIDRLDRLTPVDD